MEKKAIIGIVTILVLCLSIATVQAGISIENSIATTGTGIIDHRIDAQTDFCMSGQKYTEETKTPALGLFGISNIDMRAEFSLYTNNETDISVEGARVSNYTKSAYCLRNYDLGTVQNLKVRGDNVLSYEFRADNFSSSMVAEGLNKGYTGYNIVVKDKSTFKKIYDENYEFIGPLGFNIESYIENQTYPGAGAGDWLGCP